MAFLLKVPSLSSPGTQCRAASPKGDKDIEKGEHSISLVIFQVQHINKYKRRSAFVKTINISTFFTIFTATNNHQKEVFVFVREDCVTECIFFFKVKNTPLCSLLVGSRISIMIWYNETVKV